MCLGVPGEVIDIFEKHALRFASVRFGGVMREVCLDYTPDVHEGDYVLVHVGFAIARIDKAEAEHAWRVLEGLGETDDVRAPDGDLEGDPGEETSA